ncbi:MAG: C4-dicarboxylate TRAP transporter substrate-binding protein [Clostridiales bacterium]|nr:C4-dicarboxylate TRAP transporter substrate-binding protein [Clostridiales bacterium]
MKMKRVAALTMAGVMAAMSLSACGGSSSTTTETTAAAADSGSGDSATTDSGSTNAEVVLQIAFENSISEPLGQGIEKAQEILKEKSGGTMAIEIYPDSQLGDKSSLIDSMLLGENVCTLADGAFYADYGVPDFGIVFGPFLFDSWDQCWALTESDWYQQQCDLLEEKGLKLIASNWIYGERHTLTTTPVNTVDDLKGLKIRVPSNAIQSKGFDVLGATSTGMSLGDVYQALQTKTIDGAENPLATLYGRKLHEVAQYLILDGHVKNFTTWVVSADWFNGLTEEQQTWLLETMEEAGEYNNEVQQAADAEYLQMMKDEGVTVVDPSDEVLAGFKEKAQAFYEMGSDFGWSDGLYETVKAAMGAN